VAGVLTDELNALYAQAGLHELNKFKLMSLALIHDLGRFGTHAIYINDLLCQEVLSELDVALEHRLIVGFPHDCFSPAEYLSYLDNWSLEATPPDSPVHNHVDDQHLVVMTADMLSKVDLRTGRLSTLKEAIAYHESSRGKFEGGSDPAEFNLSRLVQEKFKVGHITAEWAKIYRGIQSWLQSINISPDAVQSEARKLRDTIPQGGKPIVVFDLGGVVVRLDDNKLWSRLAELLGVEQQQLQDTLRSEQMLLRVQQGLDSQEHWLRGALSQLDGVTITDELLGLCLKAIDETFKVSYFLDVIEYIKNLKSSGYTVVALSNTVEGHAEKMRENGIEGHFSKVFFSCELGAAKNGIDGHRALWMVCATYGVGPGKLVFIDDQEACLAPTRALGTKSLLWTTNPERQERSRLLGQLDLLLESERSGIV
jgi:FMN phosphatase YigB (HAD superfamily)